MTTDDLDRMGCQVLDIVDAWPQGELGVYTVTNAFNVDLNARRRRVALVIVDDEDGEQ